jgi:hypothetical protein
MGSELITASNRPIRKLKTNLKLRIWRRRISAKRIRPVILINRAAPVTDIWFLFIKNFSLYSPLFNEYIVAAEMKYCAILDVIVGNLMTILPVATRYSRIVVPQIAVDVVRRQTRAS